MTTINAYLTFNGNCSEAMNFYKEGLGGELTIQTVEESPMSEQWPADVQKNVLHAGLINNGLMLFGSDMNTGELTNGNRISLSLNCTNDTEIKRYFSYLSKDGQVTHPLHDFFGGTIGALTDKYGIMWLLFLEKNK